MNREEAINVIKGARKYLTVGNPIWNVKKVDEAMNMAIEALSADTVSREIYHNLVTASNDIDRALREYQDKEENGEFVSVVRCKNCRYFKKIVERSDSGLCHRDIVASAWKENGYCSRGERREL